MCILMSDVDQTRRVRELEEKEKENNFLCLKQLLSEGQSNCKMEVFIKK